MKNYTRCSGESGLPWKYKLAVQNPSAGSLLIYTTNLSDILLILSPENVSTVVLN
jgi:hypothetical protein